MPDTLYWNTVTPLLRNVLEQFMQSGHFAPFRLVGGTALSLQLGHRMSEDIDLFTDAPYESVDFTVIENYLQDKYAYVTEPAKGPVGLGRTYFIGNSKNEAVKLDLYYTDTFIRSPVTIENIRMASLEDIIAMKMDVVRRGGRKKDFWDLHELLEKYSPASMFDLCRQRHPYSYDETVIKSDFIDFTHADEDFDPNCLRGKYWELIKLDIIESVG